MRQSTLALICGLILFIVLAYSWCGRNPSSPVTGLPATPTPPPPVAATPQGAASPSVSVAQVTATPPAQTPPPEFRKVAQTAAPAIIEITVFDTKGQLLRTGNAFFVSREGLLVTSWTIVADAAYAPIVDAEGEVVGIVTSAAKDGLRPSGQLDPLLTQARSARTARWAAAPVESPTVSPTPTPKFARNPRVLYNPAPRYPYQARLLRSGPTTGSGKFRVTFDANGQVKNVQTIESTGQGLLDSAAIDALRLWRAEPGAHEWTVMVPVTFQP